MLEMEIMDILLDPTTTAEQQARMLADMMRKRSMAACKYVKQQAQRDLAKERGIYLEKMQQCYEEGLDMGYRMGFGDGKHEAKHGVDTDMEF